LQVPAAVALDVVAVFVLVTAIDLASFRDRVNRRASAPSVFRRVGRRALIGTPSALSLLSLSASGSIPTATRHMRWLATGRPVLHGRISCFRDADTDPGWLGPNAGFDPFLPLPVGSIQIAVDILILPVYLCVSEIRSAVTSTTGNIH